jgi:alkanesulfonate monooxygenase SsuD/methylene tetrahydromethanopterin reductase-like flavin-dependent oxidoreductase (luciferase family)
VARFGDGWFGWNMTGPELEANLVRLDGELAKVGRTRESVSIHAGLRHHGTLEEIAAWADVYSALGVEQMMVAMRISAKTFEQRLSEIASATGIR